MTAKYRARYRDHFGEEETTILNDGNTLTMRVRGVRFEGTDFDGFEPQDVSEPDQLSSFTLLHGSLCACVIRAEMSIPVMTLTGIIDGLLMFELKLGEPLPDGRMDEQQFKVMLTIKEQTYCSEGKTGWFEGEMLDLQSKLPSGTFVKACITCAFSDYNPCGQPLFGGLACFRGNKVGYRTVKSKKDLFEVWDTMTEFVQETYLCPEFERRAPGTGYRG